MEALDAQLQAIRAYAEAYNAELMQLRYMTSLYRRENAALRTRCDELAAQNAVYARELETLHAKDVYRDALVQELTESVQKSYRTERKRYLESTVQMTHMQQSQRAGDYQKAQLEELMQEVRRLTAVEAAHYRLKNSAREMALKLVAVYRALEQRDASYGSYEAAAECEEYGYDDHEVQIPPETPLALPFGASYEYRVAYQAGAQGLTLKAPVPAPTKTFFERSRQVNASTGFLRAEVVPEQMVGIAALRKDYPPCDRRDAIAEASETTREGEFSVGDLE